ncbi:MAG: hypothetical protein HY909_13555 [Deltaproteobacteria bacterium]|nr:hypothetical protein [Deltaproteobacteria bacterium]
MRTLALLALLAACRTARGPTEPPPRAGPVVEPPLGTEPAPEGVLAELRLARGVRVRLSQGAVTVLDGAGAERYRTAVPEGCELLRWGHRGLVRCPSTAPDSATRGTDDVAVVEDRAAVLPDTDGRTLTLARGCTPGADEPGRACTYTPSRGWTEWSLERPGRLLQVREGVALVAFSGVGLFHIAEARWQPVTLPDPTWSWYRVGFGPDGSLVGLADAGPSRARRRVLVHGPQRGPLESQALDLLADDAALEGGLAVLTEGPRAGLYDPRTDHWTPLEPALPGARRAPGALPGPLGWRVSCLEGQCTLDGVATVRLPEGV